MSISIAPLQSDYSRALPIHGHHDVLWQYRALPPIRCTGQWVVYAEYRELHMADQVGHYRLCKTRHLERKMLADLLKFRMCRLPSVFKMHHLPVCRSSLKRLHFKVK